MFARQPNHIEFWVVYILAILLNDRELSLGKYLLQSTAGGSFTENWLTQSE